MDQLVGPSGAITRVPSFVRTAVVAHGDTNPMKQLAAELGPGPFELVALFITTQAKIDTIAEDTKTLFGDAKVIGCTTAGEISNQGYEEGKIVAMAFPAEHFRAATLLVNDLTDFDGQSLIDSLIQTRNALMRDKPDWESEFNFMLIDGMSRLEDALTSEISSGLGPVPLFGGSAGDDDRFENTFVIHEGKALSNAAIITQFRTDCRVQVFKTDHFEPTDRRMVVTSASPDRRIVHEINAEPAAREYARLVGKDPNQLTTFTFAAHPLVVRVGGQHHVRSIQRVAENGDLVFFSAIDEGLVLTLAEATDMVSHLEQEFLSLSAEGKPDAILICECLLRRMEAEQKQMSGKLSDILAKNNVFGFSTYGEQINSMHVNQTLTGVAIYPPDS